MSKNKNTVNISDAVQQELNQSDYKTQNPEVKRNLPNILSMQLIF